MLNKEKELVQSELVVAEKFYPYRFSCIMAVYNVEEYIEEAIDSVLEQDIGFEEHVQLILVDDGSPDGSGAICDAYAGRYPNNIIVVHKENGGVGSSKNTGLRYATGEFVSFIDPDDKFSKNTLRDVYKYFSSIKNETYAVSIPIFLFEGASGPHLLNDKFGTTNQLVNLSTSYKTMQLSGATCFFVLEEIQKITFDETIVFAEDFKSNYELFLEKPFLGLVPSARYYYRKRISSNLSLIQGKQFKQENYLPNLENVLLHLIMTYSNRLGYIPKYLQSAIMYDLQWALKQEHIPAGVLHDDEITQYIAKLSEVLHYIDDDVIFQQKNLYKEYKIRAMELKYGEKLSFRTTRNDIELYARNQSVQWLSDMPTTISVLETNDTQIELYGHMSTYKCFSTMKQNIFVKCDGENVYAEILKTEDISYSLDVPTAIRLYFKVTVPLNNISQLMELSLYHEYDEHEVIKQNLTIAARVPIAAGSGRTYGRLDDQYILSLENNRTLQIETVGVGVNYKRQFGFIKNLLTSKKKSDKKAGVARLLCSILNVFKRKKIWIVSDRINKAGDNGEAFFTYLCKEKPKGIIPYFVISKECTDYNKMKNIGRVVPHLSFRHKLLHLLADVIISSHADAHVYNPFQQFSDPYRDILANKPFVFLQHGVTKDDISGWLNKFNKNIFGFVTAGTPEYQSMFHYDYFYEEKNIWLTGFPRFDKLYHNEEKQITVMPTWRRYLATHCDLQTGIWMLQSNFTELPFYQFYNRLLNHPRLLHACDEYNYKLKFMPHPNLIPHIALFEKNKHVIFESIETAYIDIYAESNLVLTDYSSAVFDFAYMRKPVIYSQFDGDEFFSGGHVYTKGYFDYERDGFGEVCYDLESTVDTIIEYIKNDCQLKDKYRQRIDNFFAYNDKNNCQRVYEKLLELDNKHNTKIEKTAISV